MTIVRVANANGKVQYIYNLYCTSALLQTLKQGEPLDTIFYIILIDPSERKASENEMNLQVHDCRARQPAYRVHGYGFISVPPSFIQFLSLFLVIPGPWASGSPSCWPPEPQLSGFQTVY